MLQFPHTALTCPLDGVKAPVSHSASSSMNFCKETGYDPTPPHNALKEEALLMFHICEALGLHLGLKTSYLNWRPS